MAIVVLLAYPVVLVALWFLLKLILPRLLKTRYRSWHLVTAYLVMLPVTIIGLGFLSIMFLPAEF